MRTISPSTLSFGWLVCHRSSCSRSCNPPCENGWVPPLYSLMGWGIFVPLGAPKALWELHQLPCHTIGHNQWVTLSHSSTTPIQGRSCYAHNHRAKHQLRIPLKLSDVELTDMIMSTLIPGVESVNKEMIAVVYTKVYIFPRSKDYAGPTFNYIVQVKDDTILPIFFNFRCQSIPVQKSSSSLFIN